MTVVASERSGNRPPIASHAARLPGAPPSPTLARRPLVSPLLAPGGAGIDPTDAYVRRFWVATIGAAAVADLLRLGAAARAGRALPLPLHLHVLLAVGLARVESGRLIVPERIPAVPNHLCRRMPPWLRLEHDRRPR